MTRKSCCIRLSNFTGFLLILMFISSEVITFAQNAVSPQDANQGFAFTREVHKIHSSITNRDYEIYISLPASYSMTDTVYPVLYSTDANRSFGIISGIVYGLSFPNRYIPEILVVGIGYPGLAEWGAGRHNDLTPTFVQEKSKSWKQTLEQMSGRKDLDVHSGNADQFLAFINEELIPFIEEHYRASKTDRAVFGYSLGGLFSLYAMFNSPETFSKYFAGSPSLWWDDGVLFEYEERFNPGNSLTNALVFLSAGEFESVDMQKDALEIYGLLKMEKYNGLKVQSKIFYSETHQSCYPVAVTRALRYLYGDETLP